jgi:hypothetical protein
VQGIDLVRALGLQGDHHAIPHGGGLLVERPGERDAAFLERSAPQNEALR